MRVAETGDVPETPEPTELERAVLRAGLAAVPALMAQADGAEVLSRTYSGVGFVTKLRVPAGAPSAPGARVPAVYGEHPGLAGGAEFLIELRDGRLSCIEAFCFEGLWPGDESAFRVAARG